MTVQTEYKSRVKSAQGAGTFESHGKTLYSFDYTFEDGNSIMASHTKPEHYPVGTDVLYTPTKIMKNGGFYGKIAKSQYINDNRHENHEDNLKGVKIGHALTNAVSLYCAHGAVDGRGIKDSIRAYADLILVISEEMNEGTPVSKPASRPAPTPPVEQESDLPF